MNVYRGQDKKDRLFYCAMAHQGLGMSLVNSCYVFGPMNMIMGYITDDTGCIMLVRFWNGTIDQ